MSTELICRIAQSSLRHILLQGSLHHCSVRWTMHAPEVSSIVTSSRRMCSSLRTRRCCLETGGWGLTMSKSDLSRAWVHWTTWPPKSCDRLLYHQGKISEHTARSQVATSIRCAAYMFTKHRQHPSSIHFTWLEVQTFTTRFSSAGGCVCRWCNCL